MAAKSLEARPAVRKAAARYSKARPAKASAVWKSSAREDGLISSRVLTGYRELVASHGIDPNILLRAAGVDLDYEEYPGNGKIRFQEYATLLELTSSFLKSPDFGMRLASLQDGALLMGPLEVALKSSMTVEDFYICGARHMYVYSSAVQTRLQKLTDSGQTALVLEVLADNVPYRRQAVEQLLTVAHDCALSISGGRTNAQEVWFAHGPLSPPSTYTKRFGTEVRFSEPFNALLFNDSDLAVRAISADGAVYEREMQRISTHYPYRPRICSQVKTIISRQIEHSHCSRETVAAALGLHPRTLHRRLRAEGTTFESIINQVRRDLTVHYLAQSNLELTEVAARIGYAELAVLTRACRRWFGRPPSELRHSLSRSSPAMRL